MTTMLIEYNERNERAKQALEHLIASGLVRRKDAQKAKMSAGEQRKEALTPIQELLLQTPTWSDEEYNQYVELRKHFSRWRR
jgi:ABC-type transport system involved in cytochrome c biogenesis ATPase subunit